MALQVQLSPIFLILNGFYDIICDLGKIISPQQAKHTVCEEELTHTSAPPHFQKLLKFQNYERQNTSIIRTSKNA